jgi:hypothetical protein
MEYYATHDEHPLSQDLRPVHIGKNAGNKEYGEHKINTSNRSLHWATSSKYTMCGAI